jgi:hypothetical protein
MKILLAIKSLLNKFPREIREPERFKSFWVMAELNKFTFPQKSSINKFHRISSIKIQ